MLRLQECISLKTLSKANLGYVLDAVCGIKTDKSIALSDWRQRPLPDTLLQYAALDVRHLSAVAVGLIDLIMGTSALPQTAPWQLV